MLDELMPAQSILRRRDLLRLSTTITLGVFGAAVAGREALAVGDPDTQRYICIAPDCSPYIYDPQVGDPDSGIPPGTRFEDLPDDWYCPDCGAIKAEFIPFN